MQRNKYLKILLGIVILVLLIKLLTIVFVEPWVGKKIQAELNEKSRNYQVEIDKVHILMISSGIELEDITISSKQENVGDRDLNGGIASIKFKGINLAKAIFKKDICISEITISNSSIKGKVPFSGEAKPQIIAPLNIRIRQWFKFEFVLCIHGTLFFRIFIYLILFHLIFGIPLCLCNRGALQTKKSDDH